MEINAVLGAVLGAIVGALAWAAIAAFTGYEAGLIAWGVGGAVGLGAFLLEGRGAASGIVCAVLAALAILAGKYMAIHALINQEVELLAGEEPIVRQIYDEWGADATAFAALQSTDEYPAFMVEHGYTEAESVDGIFQSEIDIFNAEVVPELQAWAASPPTFEQWRGESLMTEDSFSEIFVASLGPIDVLFFALGIGTAFRVGSGGEYE